MNHLSPHKTGLVLGTLIGGVSLLWALLVSLGWAGILVNFILKIHMISIPFVMLPFNLSMALGLVAVKFVIAYCVGASFAYLANKIR